MTRQACIHRSEGQAVVLVALVLVVLVGFVGLGIDGAHAFAQRRKANVAADAAAMAGARTLMDSKKTSGKNMDVYKAIDEYLKTHLPSDGIISAYTLTATYVNASNVSTSAIGSTDTSAVPSVDPTNSSSVRGISVEIRYTFRTFFMPLLGWNSLNVHAYGLAFVGPLGGVTGPDLVPLGINRVQASDWFINHRTQEWKLAMFGDDPTYTSSDIIRPQNLQQLTLDVGGGTPAVGSGSTCSSYSSSSPQANLSYWWCKGSAERLTSDDRPANRAMPLSSSLKTAINWRIATSARATVLFPVYEREIQSDGSVKYNIRGFLAVKLTGWKSGGTDPLTGTSYPDLVKGRIVDYTTEPGPINGNTNGFFGTYAVNLVQ
jgi:Flp pilus assembly protein TadG